MTTDGIQTDFSDRMSYGDYLKLDTLLSAQQPLSTEQQMADDALDVWLKPYERPNDTKDAMSEYLAWETDLLPRIARDGTTRFMCKH